jgi:hypothetical protein
MMAARVEAWRRDAKIKGAAAEAPRLRTSISWT